RLRIVEAGPDLPVAQVQREALRVRRLDHVQVPDRVARWSNVRKLHVPHARERVGIQRRGGPPLLVPTVEEWQVVGQDDRLGRVEPRGESDRLVVVLSTLAVLAKRLHALDELGVVRDQCSRVAKGTEVLAGIEAVRPGEPELTGGGAVTRR